jgi:Fur family ferric uptake transcriptional regulator
MSLWRVPRVRVVRAHAWHNVENRSQLLSRVRFASSDRAFAAILPPMDAAEEVFRKFLRQRKLKYTNERHTLVRVVAEFGRPFEAEELLLALREADQRISKATVYRTLKHLVESGLVKQIYFGTGKQSHYDFTGPTGAAAHDHLVDLDTGKIVPFSSAALIKLRDQVAKEMGFTAVSHRFQIMVRRGKN